MVDFFKKFYGLEMKICAQKARRLKSKIEFRRLMEKMKKQFCISWRSTKSRDIWRSGGGFGRRICKVGKGAQVENLLFHWSFCASIDVGRFLYVNKYASGLRSTNLSRILRFNFSYETDFWANSFIAARCQLFLAVVRCLFHNLLRLTVNVLVCKTFT